jgi:hypothetical protein
MSTTFLVHPAGPVVSLDSLPVLVAVVGPVVAVSPVLVLVGAEVVAELLPGSLVGSAVEAPVEDPSVAVGDGSGVPQLARVVHDHRATSCDRPRRPRFNA